MANFPTKATGSQLVTSNHQVVEYVPSNNISSSTTTVYYDDKNTVMLLDGDYGRDKSDYFHRPTQTGALKPYRKRGYYFDGTGDKITVAASSDFAFGTGDFTIEMWFYQEDTSAASTQRGIFQLSTVSGGLAGGTRAGGIFINTGVHAGGTTNNQGMRCIIGNDEATIGTSTAAVNLNAWNHVVVARESGTARFFLNGVLIDSESSSENITGTNLVIGGYYSDSYLVKGLLADIHISKGVARYTASFDEAVTNINYSGSPKDSNHKLILRGGDDESGNSHSLTFGGDCHKTVPTTGHQASFYYTTSDHHDIPSADSFYSGGGAYTIEFWMRTKQTARARPIAHYPGDPANQGWYVDVKDNKIFGFFGAGGSSFTFAEGTSTVNDGDWHYVAIVSDGSSISLYVDGTREDTDSSTLNFDPPSGTNLRIGASLDGGVASYYGYLADVRISKSALYSGTTMTVPTSPLEKSSIATRLLFSPDSTVHDYNVKRANNSLFTYYGQSKSVRRGYYLNNSTEGLSTSGTFHGITVGGGSSTFSPGTGNFTIECWVNPDRLNNEEYQTLLSSVNYYTSGTNGSWNLYLVGSKVEFYVADGTSLQGYMSFTSTGLVTGQWQHIALVRDGAASYKLYVDGVLKGTDTTAGLTVSQAPQEIGRNAPSSTYYAYYKGYIADIRLSENARYSGAFTALVTTKDSNHKLLALGGTSDESDCGHTFTFQNDAHPTAKFGNGSYYFDGTGDYLAASNDSALHFGTGDFTIETWFNRDTWALDSDAAGICGYDDGSENNRLAMYLDEDGSNKLVYFFVILGGTAVVGARFGHSSGLGAGAWHHAAVTRESGTWRFFVDGVEQTGGNIVYFAGGSSTSVDISSTLNSGLYLGRHNGGGGTYYYFDGYIDDLRISNSARYTSGFDVATAALPITSSSQQETTTDSSVLVLRPVAGSTFHESDRASTHDKTLFHLSPLDSTSLEDLSPYNMTVSTSHGDPTVDVNSTVSGSAAIVFDGNDALSVSDHINFDLRDEDFTIETWVKFSTVAAENTLWALHGSSISGRSIFLQRTTAGNLMCYYYYGAGSNTYAFNDAWSVSADTWYHVAMCRDGANLRVFINGTQFASTYNIGTNYIQDCAYPLRLGAFENTSGTVTNFLNGSLADFVITKSAKYTEAFTPPSRQSRIDAGMPSINSLSDFHAGNAVTFHAGSSEPSTPNSGSYVFYADTPDDDRTLVLSHFDGLDNGTIFRDVSRGLAAPYTYTKTGAGTVTDTSQYKFGSSSLYMNRSSSGKLTIDNSSNFLESGADFTIEAWIKIESETSTNVQYIFDQGTASGTTSGLSIFRYGSSYGSVQGKIGAAVHGSSWDPVLSDSLVSINEWHHIAFVNQSNTQKLFIDGVQQTITKSNTYATIAEDFLIGEYRDGPAGVVENYSGWIDEFRISKVARYTTNFTPPTQPFGGGLRMKAPDGKVYALSLSGSI